MAGSLNLSELVDMFHEHELTASKDILSEMIIAGKFPFAVGIRGNGEKAKLYISKSGAEEWLKQF